MSLSRSLSLLTGLVAAFGSVQAAVAHEFTAVLIAPAEPDRRAAMVAALLLASAERDGHPDETSEGHLGGIDVQLEVLGAGEYDQLAVLAPEVLLTPLEDIDPARLPASAAVVT